MKFHTNKRSEQQETNELIKVLRARNDHFESIIADLKRQHAENLSKITALVNAQADDPGLWFASQTAAEAYLQQELRKLHAAIEVKS